MAEVVGGECTIEVKSVVREDRTLWGYEIFGPRQELIKSSDFIFSSQSAASEYGKRTLDTHLTKIGDPPKK